MIPRPPFDLAAFYAAAAREFSAECDRLRSEIEEYLLWRPGERGHAAAHRRLASASREQQIAVANRVTYDAWPNC